MLPPAIHNLVWMALAAAGGALALFITLGGRLG